MTYLNMNEQWVHQWVQLHKDPTKDYSTVDLGRLVCGSGCTEEVIGRARLGNKQERTFAPQR